jgi:hypothetical protein
MKVTKVSKMKDFISNYVIYYFVIFITFITFFIDLKNKFNLTNKHKSLSKIV